jgi:predicted permease
MILIALAAVVAISTGIFAERRLDWARQLAHRTLQGMLYVLVPFVSYVNIAHLRISLSSGVGLGLGWLTICLVAVVAWAVGRFVLHLERRRLGAVVCCVVITNTGYLGNPIVSALLGAHGLHESVAWDQLVGGPALFVLGFGVGAGFGDGGPVGLRSRLWTFLTRNPPLWAAVAGLLVPSRFAPAPLPEISRWVVDAMLVTGFFAAGVYLSSERRSDHAPLIDRPDGPITLVLGARLLLAPLILLGVSGVVAVGVPTPYLIQSFMPTGLNCLIVGHAYGLDQRLIATAILWGSGLVLIVALVLSVV